MRGCQQLDSWNPWSRSRAGKLFPSPCNTYLPAEACCKAGEDLHLKEVFAHDQDILTGGSHMVVLFLSIATGQTGDDGSRNGFKCSLASSKTRSESES